MNQPLHNYRILLTLLASFAIASVARADLIDSYDGDTLTLGTVTTWTDETGSENATTANAIVDDDGVTVGTVTANPIAANTDAAFNGNTYVDFVTNSGLSTADALFSGGSSRTVAAVYDNPSGDNSKVNVIAGEAGTQAAGDWFELQSRDLGVQGDPYLAGFADDVNPNTTPQTDVLTFALATYNGTTGAETLYWAYGGGAIQSQTTTGADLTTDGVRFSIGYDPADESNGDMNVGTVDVYNNSMTSAQADAAIRSLQIEYGVVTVPEPSTVGMVLGGMALLGFVLYRRSRLQS